MLTSEDGLVLAMFMKAAIMERYNISEIRFTRDEIQRIADMFGSDEMDLQFTPAGEEFVVKLIYKNSKQ